MLLSIIIIRSSSKKIIFKSNELLKNESFKQKARWRALIFNATWNLIFFKSSIANQKMYLKRINFSFGKIWFFPLISPIYKAEYVSQTQAFNGNLLVQKISSFHLSHAHTHLICEIIQVEMSIRLFIPRRKQIYFEAEQLFIQEGNEID